MKPRRRLTAILAAAGLAAGILTAAATPASAAGYPNCASGWFCLFDYYDGGGDVLFDPYQDKTDDWVGDDWNDRAGSVANNSGAYICIYSDIRFQGHWLRLPPGRNQNLNLWSPADHHWNNKLTSYKMVPSNVNC